jgi:hypothetical protein
MDALGSHLGVQEMLSRLALGALAIAPIAAASVAFMEWNEPRDVAFPADYAKGVLYAVVDQAEFKQYRELYAPQEAIDAARRGEALPEGTVLTVVRYKAQLGADGQPARDANGRFLKGDLVGFSVMEKHESWADDLPSHLRNGEWKYRTFTPSGEIDTKTDLAVCSQCHMRQNHEDFIFSRAKMTGRSPTTMQAMGPAKLRAFDTLW